MDGVLKEMPNSTICLLDKLLLLLIRQTVYRFIGNGFFSYPTKSKAEVETVVVFLIPRCDLVEFLLDMVAREPLRVRDSSLSLFHNFEKYRRVIFYAGS